MSVSMKAARRLSTAVIFGGIISLAGCPPPPPTGGTTTTSSANITLSCTGVGFAASLGTLPNQTVSLTMTRPITLAPGAAYSVTTDLAPLALKRPNGIDLNAFNIPGTIALSASGGSIANSVGTPTHFTDTGPLDVPSQSYPASGDIPLSAAAAGAAPGAAGTITLTAGTTTIITGSTGFNCAVVGTAPSFTIPVA